MATQKIDRNMLNTGIVDNSNATAITIDSSENIGINTSSPAKQLHVYQPSGQTGILLSRGNNITGVNLQISVDSSKARLISYGDGLTFWTNSAGDGTNASEKVRITSAGNVGIGTSSPDAPLTVHNSSDPEIRVGYSSSQDHRITWDSAKLFLDADPDNANSNSALGFRVDGSEVGRFTDGGTLLVGKTAEGTATDGIKS